MPKKGYWKHKGSGTMQNEGCNTTQNVNDKYSKVNLPSGAGTSTTQDSSSEPRIPI